MAFFLRNFSILVFLSGLLAPPLLQARSINFKEIPEVVKANNQLLKAQDLKTKSKSILTGHLKRSFVPGVTAEIGGETYSNDILGKQDSFFYGLGASINLFNGFKDHALGEVYQLETKTAKLEQSLLVSHLILDTQIEFLSTAIAIEKLEHTKDLLQQVTQLSGALQKKRASGLIPSSDFQALLATKNEIQLEREELSVQIQNQLSKLSSSLGVNISQPSEIELEGLFDTSTPPTTEKHQSLIKEIEKSKADVLKQKARVESSSWLPRVDVYSLYFQQPFRQREFIEPSDRQEWVTGIKLTYNLGETIEGHVQSKALKAESEAHRILSRYKEQATDQTLSALIAEHEFLRASMDQYKDQLDLRASYQKAVFRDYIKGLRSTSDVLSAISALESTHENFLNRALKLKATNARINQMLAGDENVLPD